MKVIQKFLNNSLRNFNYIVMSEESLKSIIFDPCDITQTLPLLEELKGTPSFLMNTHYHHDHIKDNLKVLALESVEEIKPIEGDERRVGADLIVKTIKTPGHVKDHFCYELHEDDQLQGVICGDTVFNGGVGNCKDISGDVDELFETIRDYFFQLNNEVVLYPSHDYFLTNLEFAKTIEPDNLEIERIIQELKDKGYFVTNIELEKKINPFFRVFNKEFFAKFTHTSERDLFRDIRKKRDKW